MVGDLFNQSAGIERDFQGNPGSDSVEFELRVRGQPERSIPEETFEHLGVIEW